MVLKYFENEVKTMKKQIKSIFFFTLLIATFIFASCGNNPTTKPEETVKIGAILTLSGNGSANGDYTLKAIQLAVKEQNDKGGLLGKKIVLDIQDSKGDPKTGVDIVKKMVEGEKPFIIATNGSGVSLAVKPESEKNKIILLGSAATDKLVDDSNYVVRNYIESGQVSDDILKYINDSMKVKSLGLFYSNNEFGNSVSKKIAEKTPGLGIELPFSTSFEEKELDYKSIITATNFKAVPAIYVIGVGKSLGTLIKQLREAGYTGKIIADPLFNNPDTFSAAGNAVKGIAYLDFAFDKNSANAPSKTFVEAYKKEFNNAEPQNLSAITYDAIKIIFKNVEEAKTLNPDELMPKIKASKIVDGAVGNSSVNNGNIIYPTTFKVLE
jgi:branched-chain amino acid transport system substrate-binding protein